MKPGDDNNHNLQLGIARAKRIRFLREEVLKLSREEFAKTYSISKGTLQNWEDVRYSGLTDSGAVQLTKAFQAAGITDCSEEWLLYGRGKTPQLTSYLDRLFKNNVAPEETIIAQELQAFYSLHQNATDAKVRDDGLWPCLVPGDYVAGEKLFAGEINKALGRACIVQLENGDILIRKLESVNEEGLYTLICTNPDTEASHPVLNEVKVFSAAPIIWIRKTIVK